MGRTYTTTETATVLGLLPKTVAKYCKEGRIAARMRGRDWEITQEALDDFQRKRKPQGRPSNTRKVADA